MERAPRIKVTSPSISEPSDGRVGSHCLKVGRLLFISGQVARREGQLAGRGDALEQCRQALRNVASLVQAGGGSLDDVVSLNIFLKDIRFRNAIIQARAEVFSDPGPTATVVGGVDLASEDMLVEISAIACLPE
ncbi:MAG: RidA family protein [Dongiaceae bacterium]